MTNVKRSETTCYPFQNSPVGERRYFHAQVAVSAVVKSIGKIYIEIRCTIDLLANRMSLESIRDKIDGNECDLSLSDLTVVPVKELVCYLRISPDN